MRAFLQRLIIVPLFALVFVCANAQDVVIEVGANAGISNVTGISNLRASGSAGFSGQMSISSRFGVDLGLNYGLRGGNWKGSGGDGPLENYQVTTDLAMHLGFLNLSLMYRPLAKLAISAGPYLGVRIKYIEQKSETWEVNGVGNSRVTRRDVSGLHERIDAGLQIDLSYQLATRFRFNFQYQQGLRNMWAIDLVPVSRYNQYFGLGLSYRVLGE